MLGIKNCTKEERKLLRKQKKDFREVKQKVKDKHKDISLFKRLFNKESRYEYKKDLYDGYCFFMAKSRNNYFESSEPEDLKRQEIYSKLEPVELKVEEKFDEYESKYESIYNIKNEKRRQKQYNEQNKEDQRQFRLEEKEHDKQGRLKEKEEQKQSKLLFKEEKNENKLKEKEDNKQAKLLLKEEKRLDRKLNKAKNIIEKFIKKNPEYSHLKEELNYSIKFSGETKYACFNDYKGLENVDKQHISINKEYFKDISVRKAASVIIHEMDHADLDSYKPEKITYEEYGVINSEGRAYSTTYEFWSQFGKKDKSEGNSSTDNLDRYTKNYLKEGSSGAGFGMFNIRLSIIDKILNSKTYKDYIKSLDNKFDKEIIRNYEQFV